MPYVKIPSSVRQLQDSARPLLYGKLTQSGQGTEFFYSIPTSFDHADNDDRAVQINRDKPTLFFIACTSLDSRSWKPQFQDPILNQHFNMLAVDMHFTGLTKTSKDYVPEAAALPTPEAGEIPESDPLITLEEQAEDLAEFMRILDLPRVHLVSTADNNFYTYYLVLNYPELCRSVAALSPAAFAQTDLNRRTFSDMWSSFVLGNETQEVMDAFFSIFFGKVAFYDLEFRDRFFAYWASVVPPNPVHRNYNVAQWLCALCKSKAFDIGDVKRRWTVPICLVSGSDYVINPTAHATVEEVLRSSACPLLESHRMGFEPMMISATAAERVNDVLARFVARVEGIQLQPRSACTSRFDVDWTDPYRELESGAAAMIKALLADLPAPQRSLRVKVPEII